MSEERKGSTATCLLIAVILLLVLGLIGGLAVFLWFKMEKTPSGVTAIESVDALDSKELKNGLVLELLSAEKTADGLIELR